MSTFDDKRRGPWDKDESRLDAIAKYFDETDTADEMTEEDEPTDVIKGRPELEQISVRLRKDDVASLKNHAEEQGVGLTTLIRLVVQNFVQRWNESNVEFGELLISHSAESTETQLIGIRKDLSELTSAVQAMSLNVSSWLRENQEQQLPGLFGNENIRLSPGGYLPGYGTLLRYSQRTSEDNLFPIRG